jgi:uncharacterized protein (TIGR02246 family)
MSVQARLLLGFLLIFSSTEVFAGPAESANAVVDRWAAAFNANDPVELAHLYTPDAVLHGISEPTVTTGLWAVREYFSGLSGSGSTITIKSRYIAVIGDSSIICVGFYEFRAKPARFTFAIVKRGEEWLIAHHHFSAFLTSR